MELQHRYSGHGWWDTYVENRSLAHTNSCLGLLLTACHPPPQFSPHSDHFSAPHVCQTLVFRFSRIPAPWTVLPSTLLRIALSNVFGDVNLFAIFSKTVLTLHLRVTLHPLQTLSIPALCLIFLQNIS